MQTIILARQRKRIQELTGCTTRQLSWKVAVGTFLLAIVLGQASPLEAKTVVGESIAVRIESPHPYPNGDTQLSRVWSYVFHHPGAFFLKLHFSQFDLGPGDIIRLLDSHGHLLVEYTEEWNIRKTFWARAGEGETLTLELWADAAGAADGIVIDRYGYGVLPLTPESLCGSNQKEDVACYAGTPLETASRAVGRMLFEENGVFFVCTGFLISNADHFLSNEHCIASRKAVESLEVLFNFEHEDCGGFSLKPVEAFVGDRFLFADVGLDVALMTLQGRPSATYGFLSLSEREPVAGEALYLPQHSGDVPKEVSVADCRVSTTKIDGRIADSDFGHQCDTEPGSSGSPVLDGENKVIGLHHFGGCLATGGENQAVHMSAILPTLRPFLDHNLAVMTLTAPKRIILTNKQPTRSALVTVRVQNRSAREEFIQDFEALRRLVSLEVQSLGATCPAPTPVLHESTFKRALPLTLRSKHKLAVRFTLTFTCANDPLGSTVANPGHADYRYIAAVNRAVLDGEGDAHPEDDYCPRDPTASFSSGGMNDRGCGNKKGAGAFGAEVLTDIVVK